MAQYGGRFLVRGGEQEERSRAWPGVRVVVMEFADADAARAWWNSDEYAPLKELRRSASDTDIVLVEGGGPELVSSARRGGPPSQPAPNHFYGARYMTTGTFAARSATPSCRAYGCSSPGPSPGWRSRTAAPPAGALTPLGVWVDDGGFADASVQLDALRIRGDVSLYDYGGWAANTQIELWDESGLVESTTTPDGHYEFIRAPGSYSVPLRPCSGTQTHRETRSITGGARKG